VELEFLGGAGTVTGSKTLVRAGSSLVLVDCGLFQGLRHLRRRNWDPMFLEPRNLDAIVLTHAHLDHSGAVPNFARRGFRGPVYATPGTIALCEVLWPDSGRLQEEDAAYADRRGYSKHRPPRPLYTEADAEAALELLTPLPAGVEFALGPELTMEYASAGHILGASMVRLRADGTSVLFSGDLGRPNDLVMRPPSSALSADTLVLESTYGNRRHAAVDPVEEIGEIVRNTVTRDGIVLIPAFAVGRSQSILIALWHLRQSGAIPDVPVYLDSPMAVRATRAYLDHPDDHRLTPDELHALEEMAHHVVTVEESKALNRRNEPCVIVSAAGMLSGGRVLHHFHRLAPNPRNTVILVGYQAAGTRGALLLAGERRVKVHGEYVPVRCRVEHLDMMSAHADQQELLDWVRALDPLPQGVLLNHGEPEASEALRRRIDDELGLPCEVVTDGLKTTLVATPASPTQRPAPEKVDEIGARLAKIQASPSYRRADLDLDLLATDDLRATRLMLEYLKVDLALRREGIDAVVAVFGGARVPAPHDGGAEHPRATATDWAQYYEEARALGGLVAAGHYDGVHRAMVMTGGGPGIMEAASRGAYEAGARAIGLNITLGHEQLPNSYLTPELTFQFRYFGLRKMHFLIRAVALVLFPGGFGTLDEFYESLTLMQTGKMRRIPVVLVGREYWSHVFPVDFLRESGFISEDDAQFTVMVETGDDAWRAVRDFYAARETREPGPLLDP